MFDITDNGFEIEDIEKLFSENPQETDPVNNDDTSSATQTDTVVDNSVENKPAENDNEKLEKTKAFAKRLNEKTNAAVAAERENIAKSLGYASYDDMVKKREEQVMKDKGLNPEDVAPVVEELVKQRINADPRMKELETLRAQKVADFAKKELAEITKLTDGKITTLEQLPKNVLELWKQKGSLKSAYLELEGEKLITELKSEQSKGSTAHLQSMSGSNAASSDKRFLTADEKRTWKFFNPSMTDEEIDKIMIDK